MKKLTMFLLFLALGAGFCFGQKYEEPKQIDSILSKILYDFRAKVNYNPTGVDTCKGNCRNEIFLSPNQTMIRYRWLLEEITITFTFGKKDIEKAEVLVRQVKDNSTEKYLYEKKGKTRHVTRITEKNGVEEVSAGKNCTYMFLFYELRRLAGKFAKI
ncbi:MAG: hypothetical protein ABH951_00850 [Patescibacteria group bacterium]